jgi:hypothetical protein
LRLRRKPPVNHDPDCITRASANHCTAHLRVLTEWFHRAP